MITLFYLEKLLKCFLDYKNIQLFQSKDNVLRKFHKNKPEFALKSGIWKIHCLLKTSK